MTSESRKLVTIVTEAVLESALTDVLTGLGARGYTITDARGAGSRGRRSARWATSSNIRIEVLCDETVARRIEEHLREHYYQDYAMILFETDVGVLRPDKF